MNYSLGNEAADFFREGVAHHRRVAGQRLLFQQLLTSSRWSIVARLGWGTLDSLLLLSILMAANGAVSPLVVGYPLLIVASGLWFRVRFVWFMTSLSLASYGFLIFDYYHRRPAELRETFGTGPDRLVGFIDFALAMIGVAMVVAYLVSRVRALSRYYGQKLP